MTAGATIAAASQQRRSQAGSDVTAVLGHTSSRLSTITVDAISSTRVVRVIAMLATSRDSHANGENATAASGGGGKRRANPPRGGEKPPPAAQGRPAAP